MKILLIEDDEEFTKSLKNVISALHDVTIATSGDQGESLVLAQTFDLLIVDIMLPDIDGITLCKHFRNVGITTPILTLTGVFKGGKEAAKALNAGADDYLTKPFDFRELFARISALTRRSSGRYDTNSIAVKGVKLDSINHSISMGNETVFLRNKEYEIMKYLMINSGRVITRNMILEHVWQDEKEPMSNVVDVHIKNLRDKLKALTNQSFISTVHGLGYKINI